jgi:hypothetical protein
MAESITKRPPSTGFPAIPLPDAIKTISEVAKYGNRHARTAFAQYLGHDSAYSGPFKSKLAAFRDWGLVTTGRDAVELTPLAIRLALPPDPTKVPEDLLVAFRSCRPFAAIYDACAKGQPLDLETIANIAVHRVGIAASSKAKFVSSFARSVVAAGLGEQSAGKGLVLFGEQRQTAAGEEPREAAIEIPPSDAASASPAMPSGAQAPARQVPDVAVSLTWELLDGEISFVIRRRQALSSDAFTRVAAVTNAIESLAEALGLATGLVPATSPVGEAPTEPRGDDIAA